MEKKIQNLAQQLLFFSSCFNSSFFHLSFLETTHQPMYICQISSHVQVYDMVRTFWTEELITMTYITPTSMVLVSSISPRLVPSPGAHYNNLAI